MMHLTSPLVTEDFAKMTTIMEVSSAASDKFWVQTHIFLNFKLYEFRNIKLRTSQTSLFR